jgi:hypothetical protein
MVLCWKIAIVVQLHQGKLILYTLGEPGVVQQELRERRSRGLHPQRKLLKDCDHSASARSRLIGCCIMLACLYVRSRASRAQTRFVHCLLFGCLHQ